MGCERIEWEMGDFYDLIELYYLDYILGKVDV
jgi:hypothetical protein